MLAGTVQIWVYSHMASLPSVVRLQLEMVKGNHSMIKSYISDRVPRGGAGGALAPPWHAWPCQN